MSKEVIVLSVDKVENRVFENLNVVFDEVDKVVGCTFINCEFNYYVGDCTIVDFAEDCVFKDCEEVRSFDRYKNCTFTNIDCIRDIVIASNCDFTNVKEIYDSYIENSTIDKLVIDTTINYHCELDESVKVGEIIVEGNFRF